MFCSGGGGGDTSGSLGCDFELVVDIIFVRVGYDWDVVCEGVGSQEDR